MPSNYVLLKRVELTDTAASITLNNFPTTGYTHLKVEGSFRCTGGTVVGTVVVNVAINGGTANRDNRRLYGAVTPGEDQGTGTGGAQTQVSSGYANTFANVTWIFPNYRSSNYKSYRIDGAAPNNNSTQWEQDAVAGLWSDTSAITSLVFAPSTYSWAAGTTISIYGISVQNQTPAIPAPSASGGSIILNDGTYWYHAFLSSGIFTPQKALSCDYLVVAGGGAGGGYAGGGGAGGLVYATSQSVSATSYTVTIGAGGTSVVANGSDVGGVGSNSSFNSLTAGGGGGGGAGTYGGASGTTTNGSGGGGGYGSYGGAGNGTGGTGGAGNGAPGGTVPNYSSGGGGGAGANGANATSQNGGNGGAGLNTYSSWATATGTGVSGYYAGGGGGGNGNGASGVGGTGGAGGGGNGNKWNSGGSTAGTVNTGGGGGGNSQSGTSGAGGSGIIIIRYSMV